MKDKYSWFECKIKYEKTADDGSIKPASESYLVNALSFTEAEARITKEMEPFISGEFRLENVKRVKIEELFDFDDETDADRWYRSKVNFVTIDEEKGIEKKTGHVMFIKASNMQKAMKNLLRGMEGTMADYEIASMNETPIMDVYQYEPVENVSPIDDNKPVPPAAE